MKYVTTSFDPHDYDQIVLLAAVHHVSVSAIVRNICKAHLDGLPVRVPAAEMVGQVSLTDGLD
jgi:plasmid stability protein